MLQSWTPNTLPLPYPVAMPGQNGAALNIASTATGPVQTPVFEPVVIDVDDNFPKGRIARYFPHQGYGFILDRNNKDVYFSLAEIDIVGGKDKEAIRVGAPIGYDVSWTSHGLHVKKLKIY